MLDLSQQTALDVVDTCYFTIAALALLSYDSVLTLGEEIELIWPAKIGLIKLVYLFNRYVVLIFIIISFSVLCGYTTLLNDSLWVTKSATESKFISLQTTSLVVAARIFEVWGSSRIALFFLGSLWATHCLVDLAIVILDTIHQAPHFRYETTFKICFADFNDGWAGWLNRVAYYGIIILILIWLWWSTPRSAQSPVMKLAVRDGFFFLLTIFAAMSFNLIIWKYERRSLAALPYWSVWAFTAHALSRMLLSLRSAQTSEEWGQHAKISIPNVQIELSVLHKPHEVSVVTFFSDVESTSGTAPTITISTVGKYDI